jgi:serine/threonine-protein phosphatase 6 regulatory ankyrin repeat subunit B
MPSRLNFPSRWRSITAMKTLTVSLMLVAMLICRSSFCGEIHDAAKGGNLEKVKALLKDNPELVNAKAYNGWTPLHLAAAKGQKEVVELLLTHNAHVNAKDDSGETPLFHAVRFGNKDIVELLLDHGADVNAKDKDGATALDVAAKSKQSNQETIELLRQHGGK